MKPYGLQGRGKHCHDRDCISPECKTHAGRERQRKRKARQEGIRAVVDAWKSFNPKVPLSVIVADGRALRRLRNK
jgi:hypothetical protein